MRNGSKWTISATDGIGLLQPSYLVITVKSEDYSHKLLQVFFSTCFVFSHMIFSYKHA